MALIGGNTPLLEVPTTKIDDTDDTIEDEAQTKKFEKPIKRAGSKRRRSSTLTGLVNGKIPVPQCLEVPTEFTSKDVTPEKSEAPEGRVASARRIKSANSLASLISAKKAAGKMANKQNDSDEKASCKILPTN